MNQAPSIHEQFARMTAKLEDLHGLAVEGQSPHACPDMHRALLCSLHHGLADLTDMIRSAEDSLS